MLHRTMQLKTTDTLIWTAPYCQFIERYEHHMSLLRCAIAYVHTQCQIVKMYVRTYVSTK